MMRIRRWTCVFGAVVALLGLVSTAHAQSPFYRVHNLVSDGFVPADHVDPDLVNSWGIAFNPYEPGVVWVADNATSKSTLYDGNGVKAGLVVTIPGGKPTAITFSGASAAFLVSEGNPARFIFATENGTIDAWAPSAGTTAV